MLRSIFVVLLLLFSAASFAEPGGNYASVTVAMSACQSAGSEYTSTRICADHYSQNYVGLFGKSSSGGPIYSTRTFDPFYYPSAADCNYPNVVNADGNCDVVDPSPAICGEQGQSFEPADGGSCVDECPNGSLDDICLNGAPVGEPNESEDGTECKPSKDDYSGVFDGKHYCDSNLPEPATCPAGEMAYIQIDDSGSGAFVCGEPVSEPGEAEESETETTETYTDQDGNTVTVTTDGDGNTTTTISDGNGNSSTTNNYPGIDSETGEPCTSESVSCYPAPDPEKGLCKDGGSLCDDVKDIRDAIDQESDRTEKTGEFDTEQANTEVSQAKTDLETGINSIRSEIGGYFDLALSGGDMVCGPGVDVLGTTIQICPSEMKEELAVIAQIVMLIASLISLMIIFR
jgi:hypothetical protein